jgi:hypothetical protein
MTTIDNVLHKMFPSITSHQFSPVSKCSLLLDDRRRTFPAFLSDVTTFVSSPSYGNDRLPQQSSSSWSLSSLMHRFYLL